MGCQKYRILCDILRLGMSNILHFMWLLATLWCYLDGVCFFVWFLLGPRRWGPQPRGVLSRGATRQDSPGLRSRLIITLIEVPDRRIQRALHESRDVHPGHENYMAFTHQWYAYSFPEQNFSSRCCVFALLFSSVQHTVILMIVPRENIYILWGRVLVQNKY